jgi:hypothetical protein
MITFYLVVMTLFFLASAGFNFARNLSFETWFCLALGVWPLLILVARLA